MTRIKMIVVLRDGAEAKDVENVELEAERIVGSYGPREHDGCSKLPNGVCLNRIFEKVGNMYAPRPTPGTEASTEAWKKRKTDALGKVAGKRAKVIPQKKVGTVKLIKPKVKSGVKRPSDTEPALAKPVKTMKKFVFFAVGRPDFGCEQCWGVDVSCPNHS
jgi:hypothetical protein